MHSQTFHCLIMPMRAAGGVMAIQKVSDRRAIVMAMMAAMTMMAMGTMVAAMTMVAMGTMVAMM